MAEYIKENDDILSIIIPAEEKADEISFFTSENSSQQLGLMNRSEGYKIEPHKHPERKREIETMNEVLFIRKGRVKIRIIGENKEVTKKLSEGDVILLSAGHSIEMIEDSEIVAVKQGPYEEGRKEQL